MEKINEQMEVIVLSLIFLKNCYMYALIKLCCFDEQSVELKGFRSCLL